MLKLIDGSVLEVWVVAHVLYRKAVRQQAKFNLVVPTPNTRLPIQSPWLPIINKQALIMLRAAAELGFSPTARPRVGIGLGGEDLGAPRRRAAEDTLESYLASAPRSIN
jgi:phage terminase small subunit